MTKRIDRTTSALEVRWVSETKLQVQVRPIFERELGEWADEIVDEAQKNVMARSYRTGKLMRSIRTGPVYGINQHRIATTVTAGNSKVNYAWYVHDGTDPHPITPRNKKALMWMGKKWINVKASKGRDWRRGKLGPADWLGEGKKSTGRRRHVRKTNKPGKVFARKVDHPGIKNPNPFLTDAASEVARRRGGIDNQF